MSVSLIFAQCAVSDYPFPWDSHKQMPILDGIATIRIIRQMQAEQTIKGHLPTLAVTANARAEQIQTMELAGFDGTVSVDLACLALFFFFSVPAREG